MRRDELDPRLVPQPSAPLGGTLGVIALAFGIGVLGAYMLDLHSHVCCRCGHRWRHLGAFNFGDEGAHTCSKCGVVQWWKDGIPHAYRDAHSQAVPTPDAATVAPQEVRSIPRAALLLGEVTRRW
jgi:hypothetical protein